MPSAVDRVCLTGCGAISAAGALHGELWARALAGRSAIGPARALQGSDLGVREAGEIELAGLSVTLDAEVHSRSTLFSVEAVARALADAGLSPRTLGADDAGVALGTNFANVEACVDFCDTSLTDGWRGLRPTLFPNTMITTPAGHVAIHFGLRGPNATFSSGHNAGIDALRFAVAQIAGGRARVMVVVGVDALSVETVAGFAQAGLLARAAEGEPVVCAPYDARASGLVLGEGAAALVLEDRGFATARGAPRGLRLAGIGTARSSADGCFGGADERPLAQAMGEALRCASLDTGEVDCIVGSADSGAVDALESRAICRVFSAPPPVTAPKGLVGECLAASPILQLGLAAAALREQVVPPVCNFRTRSPRVDLPSIVTAPERRRLRHVLVSSAGWDGTTSAVVLGAA